jgi:methylmalonyl-CoA mutase C-terminal domain/subunit
MNREGKIKVIITKIGLDTHIMGAKLLAQTLREAGMEVVYLGKYQTPEMIVQAALQEDVDVIGISCLSANYKLILEVLHLLKEKQMNDILVVAGGTIPIKHALELKEAGVSEVFFPNSSLGLIKDFIISHVKRERVVPK